MRKDYSNIAIFIKAKEILETVTEIVSLFPEDNEMLQSIKPELMSSARLIMVKLASAMGTKVYDIKMENAALIRKAARDLLVSYHSLEIFDFEEADYYLIVRKQIEEFRLLFIDWVAGFNLKHFITDEWGLFNPPGITADYQQRSDELNFLDEDDDTEEDDDDNDNDEYDSDCEFPF